MFRIFTMSGALLGFLVIPFASLAGGFCAIVRHGFLMARARVERDVLDYGMGGDPK